MGNASDPVVGTGYSSFPQTTSPNLPTLKPLDAPLDLPIQWFLAASVARRVKRCHVATQCHIRHATCVIFYGFSVHSCRLS